MGFCRKDTPLHFTKPAKDLPGTPVYLAIGNNDSFCGDYSFDAHDQLYGALSRDVAGMAMVSDRGTFNKSFLAGGTTLPCCPHHFMQTVSFMEAGRLSATGRSLAKSGLRLLTIRHPQVHQIDLTVEQDMMEHFILNWLYGQSRTR